MNTLRIVVVCLLRIAMQRVSAQKIYPGVDEKTPSRSRYESWINNTKYGWTAGKIMLRRITLRIDGYMTNQI